MDEVLLHHGDESEDVAREGLGAPQACERTEVRVVETREDVAHRDPFLEAVEQHAFAVGSVIPQEARAEAVERRDPRLAVVVVEAFIDAARDLARGAVAEGEHEDAVATCDATPDGLLVEVHQRVRLSGARPGQHADRSGYFGDVEIEGHGVSNGGAGDLIMRAPVSWSQPSLLRARAERGSARRAMRSRPTASG